MSLQSIFRTHLAGMAATVLRFPLPLGAGLLFCLTRIAWNHDWLPHGIGSDGVDRILTFAVLAFFWSLSARLIAESRGWGLGRHGLLVSVGLGVLALKVFADQPALHAGSETILFLGPAMILLAMVAPFLSHGASTSAFWDFNRTSWLGAAFAFLAALILVLGIMLALWAIEELFGWRVPYRLRSDITTTGFAVFCPWLALARVPLGFDAPARAQCPRALSVLISYVLVPLAIGYTAIVYAYLVRILALWELPSGQVATIVSSYAGFGLATYLVAWPLRGSGPVHVRLFHRYLPYALALPLALLVVAAVERMTAYGVTEPRYLLGVLAVWLASAIAILLVWQDRRLALLPLALAVLLTLSAFGPWGAANVSLQSQTGRLVSLLTDAGLFGDGRVLRSATADVSDPSQRRDVVSIVRYLNRTGRLHVLDDWFDDGFPADDANPDDVLAAISQEIDWKNWNTAEFFYTAQTVLAVDGYEQLIFPRVFSYSELSDGEATGPDGRSWYWAFQRSTGVFTVQVGADDAATFDLAGNVVRLHRVHGDDWAELPNADGIVMEDTVAGHEARLWVERLRGSFVDGRPRFWEIRVAILLRPSAAAVPDLGSPD